MRAVTQSQPGGPELLQITEIADPELGANEVLIDVVATAVNRADLLQREGKYPPPPSASDVLGLECSGRISAIGSAVTRWKVGDEVCALLSGGGYAEKVAVHEGSVMPIPEGVDVVSAAALPEVACTVWSNLFMLAHLQPGERLLIHGGSSGIGTMAIQLAKAIGAEVAVTARSIKHQACLDLGADIAIDYENEDFVEKARPADVILDVIGAKYLERNLKTLGENGRLVVIGLQGGVSAEVNLSLLMSKRAAIIGTTLRSRSVQEKAAICASVVEHVWPLITSGDVRPVIDRIIPLSDVAQAHRVVGANEHVGKVLLTVND